MVYRDGRPGNEQSNNGLCVSEARTPNSKTRQLPSSGTVTPPKKAQLRIRTNSINGTRNVSVVLLCSSPFLPLFSSNGETQRSRSKPVYSCCILSRPGLEGFDSQWSCFCLTWCIKFQFKTRLPVLPFLVPWVGCFLSSLFWCYLLIPSSQSLLSICSINSSLNFYKPQLAWVTWFLQVT